MRRRTRERFQIILLGGTLVVALLWPLWLVVRGAFLAQDDAWTLHHLRAAIADPVARQGLLNALSIAVCVTLGTLALAMPLAMVSTRFAFRGRALLSGLLLLPMILPPFVGAIGLRHLLGREGALNAVLVQWGLVDQGVDWLSVGGFWAVVLLETLSLQPIVFLNLSAALANLDPALEEAAASAGAGRWTRFRRITLPLVRPGAFAGAVLVFIWSFTELGTPLMFEYRNVTSVQVLEGLKDMEVSRRPYALVALMLAVALTAHVVGRRAARAEAPASHGKASMARRERALGTTGTVACWTLLGGVALLSALPHVSTIVASMTPPAQWWGTVLPRMVTLEGWREALGHPLAVSSIRNSLVLATIATLIATAVGLASARLTVRGAVRGRGLIDTLVMLPLAVPGLVMAFGFVAMSLEWPFGGRMPAALASVTGAILPAAWTGWLSDAPLKPLADILGADPNPFPLLIVAYAVRRMPYVARSAAAGLQQTSVSMEEAAWNVGASRWTTLRRVVLPLIAANLVAGALLSFSFSMLEVSDSLLLAQRERDYPITKAIYVLYDRLGDGEQVAAAMGVWAMALLAVTLLAANAVIGRRMGALFRA
ncbi:MAG: ABC transporter permease [Phycisphaerales bacterium]